MINTPGLADWLLHLVVSPDEAPPILGDLREEFSALASSRGMAPARRWYWRQTAKTLPHLFFSQVMRRPWRSFAAVENGLLLLWMMNALIVRAQCQYPADWPELLRWAWLMLPNVGLVLPPLLIGWATTRVSGMTSTILTSVAIFTVCLGSFAYLAFADGIKPFTNPSVWLLAWVFMANPIAAVVCSIATFTGGLLAGRTHRDGATSAIPSGS